MRTRDGKKSAVLILFTGMLLIYVAIQLSYGVFTQPYFWDELGVYSLASMHLYENGLSLLPSSVPDVLSRGHPLLCSFYFGLAFKLFGCFPLTAHIAAALLNMTGFYFVYRILLKYTLPVNASIGALTLFVQPLFLSQSVLILPEMPLMVMTLAAVLAYLENRPLLLCLSLVAALQIKESALILPMAFLITDLLHKRRFSLSFTAYAFLLPVLSFILFIAVQKYQRGYFFYPLHTELSSFDWYFIRERRDSFKQFFVHEQGRTYILSGFFILLAASMYRYRQAFRSWFSDRLLIIPLMISGGLCFTVLNYYLSRYTVFFVVLFYLALVLTMLFCFKGRQWMQLSAMVLLMAGGIAGWNNGKVYTDVDFSYSNHVKSKQMCVAELNKSKYTGKTIGMNFPFVAVYWSKLYNGFQISNQYKTTIMHDSFPAMDYLVFTHPGNINDTGKYMRSFVFEKEFRSAYAYARIYKRLEAKDTIILAAVKH